MQTSIMPICNQQFFDSNGDPLAGGKVYTYEPGTTTAKAAYTTSDGDVEHSNPIILDSAGRSSIWLDGYYKIILKDSDDVTIWTVDNVSSQYSSDQEDFQYIDQSDVSTYISATQFSIPSDLTDTYQVGRRIEATVTSGTIYGTITASSSGGTPTITTVTVIWDSGSLDSGLSNIALGVITPTNSSLPIHAVVEKTANYTVDEPDLGKTLHANSANAIEITLLAANAVPSGATLNIQNIGAGLLTLVGTVNGQANRTFLQNEGADIYGDGTAWRSHRLQMSDPVGMVKWWHKSLAGVPQTLPWGWVEADGSVVSDSDSPLNGESLPDINGSAYFLRGSNTSGNTQANQNLEHTHTITTGTFAGGLTLPAIQSGALNIDTANGADAGYYLNSFDGMITAANSGNTEARPDNMSMVAIIKIK